MLAGRKSFDFGSTKDCSSKTRHLVQVTITSVWRAHPQGINRLVRSSLGSVTAAGLWLYLQFNYRSNEGNEENKDHASEAGSALRYSFDLAQNRTAFEYPVSYSTLVHSPGDEKLTAEVKREALRLWEEAQSEDEGNDVENFLIMFLLCVVILYFVLFSEWAWIDAYIKKIGI